MSVSLSACLKVWGKNKPTSTVVVQKVFEMSVAGDSPRKIGLFFDRSRRWARNILTNYSPESFSSIVIEKRDPERKTTEEEDEIIVKKGREKFCAPVRAVLAELNSHIKKKIKIACACKHVRNEKSVSRNVNRHVDGAVRNTLKSLFALAMRPEQHV